MLTGRLTGNWRGMLPRLWLVNGGAGDLLFHGIRHRLG
jgi:hypothetical protein